MTTMWAVLISTGILACLFVPFLVARYVTRTIPKRLAEIEAVFSDANSRRVYDLIFETGSQGEKSPVDKRFKAIHNRGSYLRGTLLVLAVTALATIVILSWLQGKISGLDAAFAAVSTEAVLALAGAYVWSVYEAISRTRSEEMTPDDLYELALRFLTAVPIGYVATLLSIDSADGAAAFVVSAFPLRDVKRMFQERLLKRAEAQGTEDRDSLTATIPGLSYSARTRLGELGINTYLDLAYSDPIELMAQSGFSLRQLLSWTDKALLAVYAGDRAPKFAAAGLPCALDVKEFYQDHCFDGDSGELKDWSRCPVMAELASAVGIALPLLPETLCRVYWNPHVRLLDALWYVEPGVGLGCQVCGPRESPQPQPVG
jgi:hypothetical protein